MFNLKPNQIFMICESIMFLMVAYTIYKYVHVLNTRINSLNNKVTLLETFIQQSNISINNVPNPQPVEKESKKEHFQPEKSQKSNKPKNVSFNVQPQLVPEQELLNMITQTFNDQIQQDLQEINNAHTNRIVEVEEEPEPEPEPEPEVSQVSQVSQAVADVHDVEVEVTWTEEEAREFMNKVDSENNQVEEEEKEEDNQVDEQNIEIDDVEDEDEDDNLEEVD